MDRNDIKGKPLSLELYSETGIDNQDANIKYSFKLSQETYIYDNSDYETEIMYEVTIDDDFCGEIYEDLDEAISAFNRLVILYCKPYNHGVAPSVTRL